MARKHRVKDSKLRGWTRLPPASLAGSVIAGLQQQPRVLIIGEALAQGQAGPSINFSAQRSSIAPKILKIVMRATIQVIAVAVPAVIEWWWGYRVVDEQALDTSAEAVSESIFADTADGAEAHWLGREFRVISVPIGAGPFVFSDTGGALGIRASTGINRVLTADQNLVFQHGWRLSPAGDPATVATLTGNVAHDIELELP